jgi:hypothetical protein
MPSSWDALHCGLDEFNRNCECKAIPIGAQAAYSIFRTFDERLEDRSISIAHISQQGGKLWSHRLRPGFNWPRFSVPTWQPVGGGPKASGGVRARPFWNSSERRFWAAVGVAQPAI